MADVHLVEMVRPGVGLLLGLCPVRAAPLAYAIGLELRVPQLRADSGMAAR